MNFKTALFSSEKSLAQRAIQSGIWAGISQFVEQGSRFIRTIILARLLVPEDFGLVGIAAISTSLLEVFSETGFTQALVQKREDVKDYLDTAWVVSVIRGFCLFGIVLLVAPSIAQFFNNPRAVAVIRIMAVSLALRGLVNPGTTYFTKELEFHKKAFITLGNTTVCFFVAIPLAFILRDVWAIVVASVAGNLAEVVLSYTTHPYRPKLIFNRSRAHELFSFGRYILASSILGFFITQGDDVFVGKVLGTSALGLYTLAYRISNMPATHITKVISRVTFPAYSKLQTNLPRLRDTYLKTLQLTAFLSMPLAGLIFILAQAFTELFLGMKWIIMVPAMQVLALAGAVRAIAATTGPVFAGLGKPRVAVNWHIVQLVILAILLYPLTTQYGILGSSIAVFVSIFVSNIGFSTMCIFTLKCRATSFMKMITIPLMNVFLASLIILLLRSIVSINIMTFVMLVVMYMISYLVSTYYSKYLFDYNIFRLLKSNLSLLMNARDVGTSKQTSPMTEEFPISPK